MNTTTPLTGPAWLHDRITEGDIIIIDGGTGTELERRGVPMNQRAWCGDAVFAHAAVLGEIHQDYIRAGADVIIANTYASSRQVLEPAGFGGDVERANRGAVEAAKRARDAAAERPVAIAGSMSNFMAAPDDPKWHQEATLRANYREQAAILAECGVDLLALEMMQAPEVAVAAVQAAVETGLPVWLGCSCRWLPGESRLGLFDFPDRNFSDLLDAVLDLGAGVVNVMHSEVRDIPGGVGMVRERWSGPVGVYPNSGYFIMPNWQFVDIISPPDLVREAKRWIADGVQLVGGCCGIGAEHIALLKAELP